MMLISVVTGCGGLPGNNTLAPVQLKQEVPEIAMEQSYYASNDSLQLLFKFEDVRQVLDLLQAATSYEYAVRSGLSEKDNVLLQDSVDLPDRKITDVEGELHLRLALPGAVVQKPNVLHLMVWQVLSGQERMGVKFRIPLQQEMMQKDYVLLHAASQKPVYKGYVSVEDKLLLKRFGTQQGPLQVERFELEFNPAAPPMSTRKPPMPKTLTASSSFTLRGPDTLQLGQEGLYLLDAGTDFSRGLLAMPNNYPNVTMAEELVPPLIYLTTSEEREALLNAPDVKTAVDEFWLEIGGNPARARELIRTFYNRVETANRLYTAHKAGWATDRGMIYIIFGQPSNVSQVGPNITWIYRESETAPYLKFVFVKKENNFTENYYELVRRREYEDSWYSTVAKWRAGKINL